ncbi:MAG TPA: protein kinase, partial [Thermoanaerobaculia bacterium]|nr:protein kinase [Thermoanaerobaculia bacterium]
MGEVYQAYDRRLERWVALKLIRTEYMENATARERFRREARAAARLSHPSIVQIYDIVESDGSKGSDAIVMELVEGEPLSRRIARGPLAVDDAIRLGRQIAEGLAAAHARGIIHRDLKPENVMVTAEGDAKILDFGLAKRVEGEASLTEDHRVIGTFRSMSPEQARGLSLDHRSDLFSFGILLYEMLSGQSPFAAGSTLETLTRICGHRQTPLRDLNPGIPEDLSNLVDHLLEKNPILRLRSARAAFAALEESRPFPREFSSDSQATLLEGPLRRDAPETEAVQFLSRFPEGRASRISELVRRGRPWVVSFLLVAALILVSGYVLYLRFMTPEKAVPVAVSKPFIEKGTELGNVGLLASGLRIALLETLTTLEGVSPLAPELVDPVEGSPIAIARGTAAQEVLTSRIVCASEICRIFLYRIRGEDGRLLWTQSFTVPLNNLYLLPEVVQTHLSNGYKNHSRINDTSKVEVREADYIEYLRLWRDFDSSSATGQPLEVLISQIERIRHSSPRFLEASLFHARLLEQRFHTSRNPEDLERSLEVLRRARVRFPADPRPIIRLIQLSLTGQWLEEAEAAIRDLERLDPGNPEILIQRARLLQRRGQSEQARILGREAVERAPSWRNLFWAADLEIGSGDTAAAREYLEDLLRRHPGHYEGRS